MNETYDMRYRWLSIACTVVTLGSVGWILTAKGVAPLAAQGVYTVNQKPAHEASAQLVSVDVRNVTIFQAIQLIAQQAKLRVTYGDTSAALSNRVTVQLRDANIRTALEKVLQGTDLIAGITPEGDAIFVRRNVVSAKGQDSVGILTVTVIDSAKNEPVSGASISVRGTRASGVTNARGMVVLRGVPAGTHTVEAKLLGYKTSIRTVQVVGEKPVIVRIVMAATATMLSGVVTTATGEQRKLEVGNSIVSLNVDSLMKVAPISSVTDLLESRVPGMSIQRTSGSPGDPARVRLRGTSSISLNNDPIIIVDGIRMYSETSEDRNLNQGTRTDFGIGGVETSYATPSPLDQIDPNAIERIEVQKGPSAAALYGSDAANGVIIITTKRGRVGQTRWTLTGNYGMSYFPEKWPTAWFKFVSSSSGGASRLCWGYCGDVTVDSVIPFQALNDSRSTALGTGSLMNGSISVNGGSQNTTYNLTVSGGNQLGVLKLPKFDQEKYRFYQGVSAPGWMKRPDRLESQSGNVAVKIDVSKNTTVDITTGLTRQIQRRTSMSRQLNGAIGQLQEQYVDFSVFRPEPLLGNPYERVVAGTLNLKNALSLQAILFTWLPITATVGFNSRLQDNETRLDRDLLPGALSEGAWNGNTNSSTELTGRMLTNIPVMTRLTLAVGAEFTRGTTNDQRGGFRGFPDGVSDPSEGTNTDSTIFRRSTSERKSIGWWLEPRFNVRSQFFVMPGFRLDNNGLRGDNAGFNGLPKMSFSWIASDAPFFPLKDIISQFRIRTGFGVAGVQPRPGQGSRLYQLSTHNPFSGVSSEYGDILLLSHVGNASLRPERGVGLEGGFDMELWNGRLTFDVTYANQRRKDAIITERYTPSANGGGGGTYGGSYDEGYLTINLGDIQNSSTEIVANAQIIERRAIGLQVGMNMTRRRSKILRLRQNGTGLMGNGDIRYVVGYPMEAAWARPIIGFVDVDGDGMISRYEISRGDSTVYVGSTEPAFELNGHQNMTLLNGRLTLNAVWSYKDGALQTRAWSGDSRGNLAINAPGISLGSMAGWVTSGPIGNIKDQIGRMMIVDILRLESFSMGYNLGPRFARVLRARTAGISVQGKNLGLWTNYAGVDPNVNAYSTGNLTRDAGTLPAPREWNLRLSLGW